MKKELIPVERIAQSVHQLRDQKVLLDFDLAIWYAVPTKALNQAVKRNATRFPEDFMFRLTLEESQRLLLRLEGDGGSRPSRSQTVTLKRGKNIKYRPYAFT